MVQVIFDVGDLNADRLGSRLLESFEPVPAIDQDIMLIDLDRRKIPQEMAVATAAFLSGPLAAAIKRAAAEQDRSQSWTLRDLVRCELRHRGLLPTNRHGDAQDDLEVDAMA